MNNRSKSPSHVLVFLVEISRYTKSSSTSSTENSCINLKHRAISSPNKFCTLVKQNSLLSPNEVWGKIIFSQMSVCQRGRRESLCPGGLCPLRWKSGRYASYWNAFLFDKKTQHSLTFKPKDDLIAKAVLTVCTRGGSRISRRTGTNPRVEGAPHTICQNFPKNSMKLRTFWATCGWGALRSATAYLKPCTIDPSK